MTELPQWFLTAIAGVLGLMLGSFLNVCIVRWGAEPKQSVVRPRSRCPRCGASLKAWDNIPVLSWLLLRGKCRSCGMPISPMYPLVELATGLIWAWMFWRLGDSPLAALAAAVASTILLGVALTDARNFVIPHEFTLGGAVIALGFGMVTGWPGIQAALVGGLIGAGLILLIGEAGELLLGQEAMGGGDAALMGMIGAFFGWEFVLLTLLSGALVSIILFAVSRLTVSRAVTAAPRPEEAQAEGLRWGMVGWLLLGGLILLVGIVLLIRLGGLTGLLGMLFYATCGAGVGYYMIFIAPTRIASSPAARVRGMLGASLGMAATLRLGGIAVGSMLLLAVLLRSRRMGVMQAPDSTEELNATGYLPFGVGLALAATVLIFLGGSSLARSIFSDLTMGLIP